MNEGSSAAPVDSTPKTAAQTKNTPARAVKRTPSFRPPLRRHSTQASLSKLHAAFKSPLRTPDNHDSPQNAESTTTVSTTTASPAELTLYGKEDKTRGVLKTPRLSGRPSARHTPYRLPPAHPRPNTQRSRDESVSEESAEGVAADVARLKDQLERVESEIAELSQDYHEEELQQYIDHLHEYNEIKDVGQMLLGKLAEVQGTTTAQLYQQFDLNLDD